MSYTFLTIETDEWRDAELEIADERYHHLVRVLRLTPGALLHAALPDGRVLQATITEITKKLVRAAVTGQLPAVGQSCCHITLYQAMLKGEKMEWVIQKACELGAATLTPVITHRSIPRWDAKQTQSRTERWQRIAAAAADQCERSIPLQLTTPVNFATALAAAPPPRFFLHERDGQPLRDLAAQYATLPELAVFIGPEGGWDSTETTQFLAVDAHPIHLGGRILRAETAAVTALTLLQYLWGDL